MPAIRQDIQTSLLRITGSNALTSVMIETFQGGTGRTCLLAQTQDRLEQSVQGQGQGHQACGIDFEAALIETASPWDLQATSLSCLARSYAQW